MCRAIYDKMQPISFGNRPARATCHVVGIANYMMRRLPTGAGGGLRGASEAKIHQSVVGRINLCRKISPGALDYGPPPHMLFFGLARYMWIRLSAECGGS